MVGFERKKGCLGSLFLIQQGPKNGKRETCIRLAPVFPVQMPAKSRYSRGKPERGVSGALTANGAVVR
ncbi:hypothetical protein BIZ35_05345 [Heyndrickxia coagulans]|nr:hypothetical protein BIZ35_05345 [Heyndrickxia coagulans]AVD56304.1 hypothetical protein C3766_09225 [Heyndrickxia coagulans]